MADTPLKLSFGPQTGGTIDGQLTAVANQTTKVSLAFAVNSTKRRRVNWLNFNLKAATISGKIYATRTNPNGDPSSTTKIPLGRFQTASDEQENKVTIDTDIFLDDGDVINLDLVNSDSSPVDVDYAGTYELA